MTIPNLNSSYSVGTQSLLSVMPDPATDSGVFNYLSEFPFIDPVLSNMEYLYNRSGDKVPSPLVSRLADGDVLTPVSLQSLARVIKARYQYKWNRMWTDYSDANPIYNNVNLTTETQYGKQVSKTGTNSTTKDGTETRTLKGTETRTESYDANNPMISDREITGSYTDNTNETNTRSGIQEVTESVDDNNPRKSTKVTTGGYSDTDGTVTTRTGTQIVTDKGDTSTSVFGFNSSTAVKTQVTGPDNDVTGITTETSYGDGLVDTRSGAITRSYNSETGLQEETTESGSRKTSTTFGDDGLKDSLDSGTTRTYNEYHDKVTNRGSKSLSIDYGARGRIDELAFDGRTDFTSINESVSNSGKDTINQTGYNIRRATDRLEIVSAMYNDPMLFNFYEIIYSDIDEVLTIPMFMC